MKVPPIVRTGFVEGVKTSFDPSAISPSALWEARNIRSDESGILRLRRGCEAFNVSLGVGAAIQAARTAFNKILTVWNRNVYLFGNNGVPTTLGTNLIGTYNADMASIFNWARNGAEIAYILAGNGLYETDGTTMKLSTPYAPGSGEKSNLIRKEDGTQDVNTGPMRCKFGVLRASLSQRLALAGDPQAPNAVYLSGPLDATYYPSDQVLQLPDDGGKIVALENWYNALIIFRTTDIWAFFGSDLTDASAALVLQDASAGCIAHRSIANVPGMGIMFLGADNIYALQGVSGIENQSKAVPVGDDVRKFLLQALKDGTEGVSAIYHDREYRISFPKAQGEERVFRYFLQNGSAWYIDSGPRTSLYLEHGDKLYGCEYTSGKILKFTEALTDEGVRIPAYVAFKREDVQPGPARIKRLIIYALSKGRRETSTLYFMGGMFNSIPFNKGIAPEVFVQLGTEQHLNVTVVVDGTEFSSTDLQVTVDKVNHLRLATTEPVRVYEATFRPSLKGHFVQIRLNADTINEDIAVLGYGIEYSPHGRIKGAKTNRGGQSQ